MSKKELPNQKDILLYGTVPPPIGGDAIWMEKYINELSKRNISFSFVDNSLIGKRAETISNKKNIVCELKRYSKIKKQIKKELKENTFEKCHFNTNCSPLGTIRDYLLASRIKRNNIRLFIHCHCNIQDQIGKNKISLHYLKKMLKLSKNIFVLNLESLNFLNNLGFSNVHIVPNFIESTKVSKNHVINESVKNVVFVGHVIESKGIEEFLQLAKKYKDIKFNVLGKVTGEFDIHSYIKYNNLSNVSTKGNLPNDQVLKEYDSSDIFVFPSHTEGFSLALLEAMARGIPTIATDVGANKEMLLPDCGMVVEANKINELENAFDKLINNKQNREMFSINSIKKVEEKYNIEGVVNYIFKLYSL